MKFVLEIECDNAAFTGDMLAYETSRLLADASQRVTEGSFGGIIRDANGNRVGTFHFVDED